jgi:3-dehydroquinate synthase
MTTTIVSVGLGERAYAIHIDEGLLAKAGAMIKQSHPRARVAIVSDKQVYALHGKALEASLAAAGIDYAVVLLEAGEKTKSFAGLEQCLNGLLAAKIERNDVVLAFGGGVIGDLAGFAASILRRGVQFVQMPTTLLAQVDSSVGGKTGINTAFGKNLVGAFYQPSLVLADIALLETLSPREFAAGYAEVAKYGLINNAPFFEWLEENKDALFNGGSNGLAARRHAIVTSCQAKAAIVARDEKEMGDRALLNLGHTFGHALEAAVKYDSARLVHGEAVSIGICQAFRYCAQEGLCPPEEALRVEAHFQAVGLPTRLMQDYGTADSLLDAIRQDKKVSRGKLTFILTRGIGKSFIAKDVEAAKIGSFLEKEIA